MRACSIGAGYALAVRSLVLLLAACAPKPEVCRLTLDVPWPGATVEVSRFATMEGPGRLLGTLPVQVGGGEVTLESSAGTLLDGTGNPTPQATSVAYYEATEPGEVTITASAAECEPASVVVTVVPQGRLAGRSRPEEPGFGYDGAFLSGEDIEVAVDPALQPDRVGLTVDAYVVPHRAITEWATDPELVGDPVAIALPAFEGASIGAVEATGIGESVDIVMDADRDGALSPGDLVDFGDDGIYILGDFAAQGEHSVETIDVDGGDWLGERIWWPADIASSGPVPLVVISHGNGHEYTWYDYLGEHLASHGFVVMAHENRTQPGIETAAGTTLTNTDWFLANLPDLAEGALAGLVDADRVAWIGHSRGGEGVVYAYAQVRDGEFSPSGWSADSIRVIASIAPTVFYDVTQSNPFDVRYHILSGSSDGDVTGGPDYGEVQYYRMLQAGTGVRSSTYIYGASHEDFDCCGRDDGAGPDQLSREDVQEIAKAYLLAVVTEGIADNPYARETLRRDPVLFPATAFDATATATWHPVGTLVIDDFQSNPDPARASSGAAITATVENLDEGRMDDQNGKLNWTGDDPMNGMTQAHDDFDSGAGGVFDFESAASIAWELPGEVRDWTGREALSVRACQGTRHPLTVERDAPITLSFTVTDAAGVSVTRSAGSIAAPYLRGTLGDGEGWSNAFSTVRVPLVDFVTGGTGLDLSDIRFVTIEVGADGPGRLGIDDLEVE